MFSQTSRLTSRARFLSGRCYTIDLTVAASAIAAAFVAAPAAATVLFQEDFEAYAVGSNLTGQGGWVPDYVNSALSVGNGSFLPTKVLNGLAASNNGMLNFSARPLGFALDPNRITTLAVDAYASSGARVHDTVIGFGNASIQTFTASGVFWTANLISSGRWDFNAVPLTGHAGDSFIVVGGYGTPVKMSIVVDGVANEVYGIYDFGGGPLQTPHYAITDVQIATLNEVGVVFDFRSGTRGAELDNLRVFDNISTAVPEPGTAVLVSASLGLLGFARRRR